MGIKLTKISFYMPTVSVTLPSMPKPRFTLPVSTKKQAAELIVGATTGFFATLVAKKGSATNIMSLLGEITDKTKVDSKEITNLMNAVKVRTGKNEVAHLVAALLRGQNKSATLIKQFEMTHKVGLLNKHGRKIAIGAAGVAVAALATGASYYMLKTPAVVPPQPTPAPVVVEETPSSIVPTFRQILAGVGVLSAAAVTTLVVKCIKISRQMFG